MDPLTLAILGGVGLFTLFAMKKPAPTGASGTQPPAPGGNNSKPTPAPKTPVEEGLKVIMDNAPIVGAVVAINKVAGEVAGEIGQTQFAKMTGYTFGFTGVQAVAASQVGKEIDRQFGGTGNDLSGQVIQGGFGVAVILGAIGLSPLAIVGFGLFAFQIWVVVQALEDAKALAFGQKGALDLFKARWAVHYWQVKTLVKDKYELYPKTANDFTAYAERLSVAMADGLTAEMNAQAYRAWMAKPRGLLIKSDYDHAKYGLDRARFVGPIDGSGKLIGPALNSSGAEYIHWIPFSERSTPSITADIVDAGRTLANGLAYAKAMAMPRGVGQSNNSHLSYYKKEWGFEGTITGDGNLLYKGTTYEWKKLQEAGAK